jgi:integrase
MAVAKGRRKRARGSIVTLPSGSLRARVYAGYDPVTGKRHYLDEVIPPGPKAQAEAERVLTRLLNQVDERRNPKTSSTVNQLLDRYLKVVDVDESTLRTYCGYIERHIRPVLGTLPVGKVDGEVLDSFYGELRRCRDRCKPRARRIDHRTTVEHECDKRCGPHKCRPLAASTVRQIHWILSGAFDRAVRWNWVSVTPSGSAEPPAPPRPNPDPPSAEEAARIVVEAWKDPDWGAFLWVAMTTGARRGELCGLRRSHLDPAAGVLRVPRSVGGTRKLMREKDTKTHQQRRVALDAETLLVLREHVARQDAQAEELGIKVAADAYLFSLDPDCCRPLVPDSVTQRYDRMVTRLGIKTTLHKLRHYNATELLTAGVDLRTVAGRLGHGGGGTTTLRVYAAWVDEAGQKAAETMAGRMPGRPRATDLDVKGPRGSERAV